VEWLKSKVNMVLKYKYVILVIIVGVVLMLLPSKMKAEEPVRIDTVQQNNDAESIRQILQQVKGAGRVEVYLKTERSEQYVYQTDSDSNTSTDREDVNEKTILITDSGRNQTGLIKTVLTPKYMGAVIVCQGADDPQVRLSIVDAVSKVTGLGSDKISVLKMK